MKRHLEMILHASDEDESRECALTYTMMKIHCNPCEFWRMMKRKLQANWHILTILTASALTLKQKHNRDCQRHKRILTRSTES